MVETRRRDERIEGATGEGIGGVTGLSAGPEGKDGDGHREKAEAKSESGEERQL